MFSKTNQSNHENSQNKILASRSKASKYIYPFSTISSSLIPKSEESRIKQYSKSGRSSVTKQYTSNSRDEKNELVSIPSENTASTYFSKGIYLVLYKIIVNFLYLKK